MKPNKNRHYSKIEKAEIIADKTYISNLVCDEIATALDTVTFRDLKDLVEAIKIFSKGKP